MAVYNKKTLKKQNINIEILTSNNRPKSLDLIYTGTAKNFINALCMEALNHEAVNHEYLKLLSTGNVKNKKNILRDYAYQYGHYSDGFTTYLKNVVDRLTVDKHKKILMENFNEEFGNPNSEKFEDWPHNKMFAAFAEEVGINDDFIKNNPLCLTAKVWRELFDQKCKSEIPGVGIGAIGIATEFIVPHIYSCIVPTIKKETSLSSRCAYFFELHSECDVEHGNEIIECAIELAENEETREGIRFGVISALNLRKAFWDVMYSRSKML